MFLNSDLPDNIKNLVKSCSKKSMSRPDTNDAILKGNVKEMSHVELVQNFRNKERAIKINLKLLEFDRYAPYKLDLIDSYIRTIFNGLK